MISNKLYALCVCLLALCSYCSDNKEDISLINKKNIHIHKDSLLLVPEEGLVYHLAHPFSGTSFHTYSNGRQAIEDEYINGKKNGLCKKWFDTGLLSYESEYKKGKKNGYTRTWWKNGKIRSESMFIDGLSNGVQRQWYKSCH